MPEDTVVDRDVSARDGNCQAGSRPLSRQTMVANVAGIGA